MGPRHTPVRADRRTGLSTAVGDVLADPRSRALIDVISPGISAAAAQLGPYAGMSVGQLVRHLDLPASAPQALAAQLADVSAPAWNAAPRIAPTLITTTPTSCAARRTCTPPRSARRGGRSSCGSTGRAAATRSSMSS